MAKTLPDVAVPVLDLYRVCYQHNGQPLDQGEEIRPGIQGKFETRGEAERSRESCLKWFNIKKSVEIVGKEERFTVRERDVITVWIEHYNDGVLVISDKPKSAPSQAVSILEQPRGMQFAAMLHEMLCETNTPDEAAEIMDRHTSYVADCASGGTSLSSLRACAAALGEKEAACRSEKKEEPESKPAKKKEESKLAKAKDGDFVPSKNPEPLPDPRGAESFPALTQ